MFVSQKGARADGREQRFEPAGSLNDPALENEYLKRLMAALALTDSRQASGGWRTPSR